jgi:DNA-binding NarL/FixJ family response regulator
MAEEELWKPVQESPNYFVSNFGNVKSNKGRVAGNLKLSTDRYGYRTICISTGDKRRLLKVHRLVAQAFVDNPDSKPHVCHIDGNKQNNTPENLYWGNPLENNRDKIKHGTIARGEAQGLSKLTKSEVLQIKDLLSKGISSNVIGKEFDVHKSTIKTIKSGKSWSWLTN